MQTQSIIERSKRTRIHNAVIFNERNFSEKRGEIEYTNET